MKQFVWLLLLAISGKVNTQPLLYTVSQSHSHNDYEQAVPFWTAYKAGFGSIEADIFLKNGVLLVAHKETELVSSRSLLNLYLTPLVECIKQHQGYPYADSSRSLQMLIDIKSDSIATLANLIAILQSNEVLMKCPKVSWVITGRRPAPDLFPTYPAFISFDGELDKQYDPAALKKISLLSDNFRKYSKWDGKNGIPEVDRRIVAAAVNKAHQLHKPVRFWAAPDQVNAWQEFMKLKVDWINTDHIPELSAYLLHGSISLLE